MFKAINKILNSWFIFTAAGVSKGKEPTFRRTHAVVIMSIWITMIVLNVMDFINAHGWPFLSNYYNSWPKNDNSRSIYNPTVQIFLVIFLPVITLSFCVSKQYKNVMDKIITPKKLENMSLLIYGLCIMLSLLMAFEYTAYMLLFTHFLTIIYFYFTKSTFGLKLDEQAALGKNNS